MTSTNKPNMISADAVEQTSPRKSRNVREVVADINGVSGFALLIGPNVVAGLTGLPETAVPFLATTGGVLILRYLMMRSLINKDR